MTTMVTRSVSIRRKLTLVNLLGSGTALLTLSLALLGVQIKEVRSSKLRRLETFTDVIAFNCAAALDFNDPEAATLMLAALKTRPEIMSAGIVSQGRVFATYVRPGSTVPATTSLQSAFAMGHLFSADDLTVCRPVTSGGRHLGMLFVQSDLREIGQTLRRFALITGIVAIPALAIAVLISVFAQRAIAGPILSLASLAETVSMKSDYSIRSPEHRGVEEIEQLVTTFNQMLAEIQEQHFELLDAQTMLEQRVIERTRDLEARSRELEARERELAATNKELEAFSYSVSHDLRAPLRAIDGFSKILVTDYENRPLDEQGLHFLARVRAGTQRMGSLIDDLLELSRVTRSDLVRKDVDLSAIARGICDELGKRHSDRQVECKIEDDLHVFADSRLMTIALENVMGNAWKFTTHVPDARVEVGRLSGVDEQVFYVRDNGAGFDMKYADKLFGAFQRMHTEAEFEGTGIGLATVQRIINRHGGRIWAKSEKGKGAQFFFTLGEGHGQEHDTSR